MGSGTLFLAGFGSTALLIATWGIIRDRRMCSETKVVIVLSVGLWNFLTPLSIFLGDLVGLRLLKLVSDVAYWHQFGVEAITVAAILAGALTVVHYFSHTKKRSAAFSRTASRWMMLGVSGYLGAIILQGGSSYLGRNAAVMVADNAELAKISGGAFITGLLLYLGFALVLLTRQLYAWQCLVLMATLSAFTYMRVSSGSRIWLFAPIVVVLFMAIKRPRKLVFWKKTLIAFFVVFLFWGSVVVSMAVVKIRGGNALMLDDIYQEVVSTQGGYRFVDIVSDIALKFDNISMGVLLRQTYGDGFAGYKPLEGAVFALVPRVLFINKPVPGGFDGTISGTPARLIATGLGQGAAGNVGVAPVAVTQWQNPWFIPLLVVVAVATIVLIDWCFRSSNPLIFSWALMMVNFPNMIVINPIEQHVMLLQRAAVIVGAVMMWGLILRTKHIRRKFGRASWDGANRVVVSDLGISPEFLGGAEQKFGHRC